MAEEVYGTLYFQLKLQGREGTGLFTEATGGGSENAVIEQKVAMPNGSVAIKKIPGNLKFTDLTLKRGVDPDKVLWDWRQQVVDGKFKEARCNGTIQMLDSTFAPVATYSFENGWVSKYTPAAMNAGQDQAAVEEITIAIENFKRE
jgi:phage tail-like protein